MNATPFGGSGKGFDGINATPFGGSGKGLDGINATPFGGSGKGLDGIARAEVATVARSTAEKTEEMSLLDRMKWVPQPRKNLKIDAEQDYPKRGTKSTTK